MRLVLDSNEYILGFGSDRDPASEELFAQIALKQGKYSLSICRPIIDEAGRHLLPRQVSDIYL